MSVRVLVLLACAAQFMLVLDVSIVNVALPSIKADLDMSVTGLQWVVNAYALVFAGFLLLGGRIADLVGTRRVFVAGLGLFTVASLAGGLAWSSEALLVARAAQGLGGAVLAPATLTLLTTTIPDGPDRTRAIATWAAVGSVAGAVGGVLGGVLTELAGWRLILLINLPIGIAVIVAALRVLPARPVAVPGAKRLDLLGAITATVGLTSLTAGVVAGPDHGWATPRTIIPLAFGAVMLTAFVVSQRRTRQPLLPLRLFASRDLSVANVVTLLAGTVGFSMWFFVSQAMQNVLHFSAIQAGLAFLPHAIALTVAARLVPTLVRRFGVRPVVMTGSTIAALGFLWQAQLAPGGTFLGSVLGPAVLMCSGLGLLMTPLVSVAMSGVDRSDAGIASGVLSTARQTGGALGLAISATVAASYTITVDDAGLAAGYTAAFTVSAAVMVVATSVALLLPRAPSRPGLRSYSAP